MFYYRVGQKCKLLILSECVNKTDKIGGMWTNKNSYRENEVSSDIFTWNILCPNCITPILKILWLKAINEITAKQTRTSLCKHDVIKVCSIEYLTTQIELVLPTFFRLLDVHKIIEYLTLGLLKYLSQYNSLLFWPTLYIHKPCTISLAFNRCFGHQEPR